MIWCWSPPAIRGPEPSARCACGSTRASSRLGSARKALLAISREAYSDPRFKFFSDLPEDTYEAFLSVPITARQATLGVINVQHRAPHSHTGDQMEALTSIGELVGCLLLLSGVDVPVVNPPNYAELALRSVPIAQES